MFDINGSELLIILVIAMVVIGPQRLPEYAQQLRDLVKRGRDMIREGKQTLTAEAPEVDWKQYDPRQYDPRRIVKEALAEESPLPVGESLPTVPRKRHPLAVQRDAVAPYDPEAT
ncbi:Sec-independent protein translocase subunit TatA/TatB [Demequina salsinemoris]|uniref:Sec-independent protein translocase subunit TatA/TatB n=1 Tax=Demequina salsinemoris TaxID=577470 RepID=UPI00078127E6|nr:twin-arginine translocase TatA/TatE family subunit [Demequina salsinemoris]